MELVFKYPAFPTILKVGASEHKLSRHLEETIGK